MIDCLMVRRIQIQINSMHLQRDAFTLTFLVLSSKVEKTTFLEMNHLIFDKKVLVKNRTFTCHHQAPAGSRIFNPGISGTGFGKIPGSRDFPGRD